VTHDIEEPEDNSCPDCGADPTVLVTEPQVFQCCNTESDVLGVVVIGHGDENGSYDRRIVIETSVLHSPLPYVVAELVAQEGRMVQAVLLHPAAARRFAAAVLNAADIATPLEDAPASELPDTAESLEVHEALAVEREAHAATKAVLDEISALAERWAERSLGSAAAMMLDELLELFPVSEEA
jgi:hypothetical protein